MLSPERLKLLRAALERSQVDGILITQPENRRYISGFSGSAGTLLVTADKLALITDGRYWSQVEEQCPELELVKFRADEHGTLMACAAQHLSGWQGRLGIESRHLVLAEYEALQKAMPASVQLRPLENVVEEIRQKKDPGELELLRKAAQLADRAFRNALESLKVGIKEQDFCLELEYQMQKLGARKPAFDSIVASGPNGAYPHAGVTDRVIQQRELITVDFGAYRHGYNSDMTRTVWLGRLDERNAKIYRSVREAQQRAVEAVQPGKTCKEIDAVARQHLQEAGLGDYFTHGLGHGLGMAVHELPSVRSTSDTLLEPGMVITIEPGVYIGGEAGCRIEDSVVVTASGCEKLTRTPYQDLEQTHPLEAVGA